MRVARNSDDSDRRTSGKRFNGIEIGALIEIEILRENVKTLAADFRARRSLWPLSSPSPPFQPSLPVLFTIKRRL